jgi:hypothetical protein
MNYGTVAITQPNESYIERSEVNISSVEEYHIPEDDTLHNHRCENLKSYISSVVHTAGCCRIESASHYT